SMVLELEGFAVEWSRTGDEALAAITADREAGRTPCDVVLLDLMLPDMSGVQLVRRFEAIGFAVPLVLHSAASDRDMNDALERTHAIASLRKPTDSAQLTSALRSAVRTHAR